MPVRNFDDECASRRKYCNEKNGISEWDDEERGLRGSLWRWDAELDVPVNGELGFRVLTAPVR